jgi:16S rRNA (adenine1518-N6/adenine1519-N6)-dimethyltransferase
MVRLGQNFLADPNLLDAIVRDTGLQSGDVALEIGGGEGVLTERIAERVAHLHVVEIDDELADGLEDLAERAGNVSVVRGDAMRLDLATLDPAPTTVPSNLPYSVATPLLLRTIAELPGVERWTVMVQREIADRLRAEPGTREYGSASVVVQLACEVRLLRAVDPAVFVPRPRVGSALLALRRTRAAPPESLVAVVRAAFAHRRKSMARSLELSSPGSLEPAQRALEGIGCPANARAEVLSPTDFERFAQALAEEGAAP